MAMLDRIAIAEAIVASLSDKMAILGRIAIAEAMCNMVMDLRRERQ